MLYDTQNHWDCGLCPSSGILRNCKTQRFGTWICFRLQVMGEIERDAYFNHWTKAEPVSEKLCFVVI
jgi:hypothetical protein